MSQAIDDARQNSNDAVAALSASAAAYSAVSRTCLVAEVAAKNAQVMADAAAKIGRLAREAANLARVDLKRKERSEATASKHLAATIGIHRCLRKRRAPGFTRPPPDPEDSGDTE